MTNPQKLRALVVSKIMGTRRAEWLDALINTQKFFVGCSSHEAKKKNEKNICCLDCCTSICPHCVPSHRSHRLLQVRRYVYHDVVRLEDMEKLFDCTNVQSYTINSSKVVFIQKRPQSRQLKGCGNICTSCDRCLQEPYLHCSLGCKVEYILKNRKDISPYLKPCKTMQLSPDFIVPADTGSNDETDNTNHSTVIEGDEPTGSSDSDNLSVLSHPFRKKRSGEHLYRRRRSSSGAISSDGMVGTMSRRKGFPHRSPLH